mmetsp:Transcript_16520/g.15853  ORF Transcript_16520/g.15853 Transcript_16520/m.15853 type:complete len:210 (-) Transcript_16520:47-676(-)|eukprot:CAMPEP_0119047982 /NCGR_PEP_ID=MMETSP1177-20130426/56201_1 /TAXON_ID=2985 /ORGANISM="Ochromonas sp, Strain CCMP1899" /LENGTH=209 /DNA_ID=CAMNT_0007023267 /DNA_START=236 /DNA_END=865 /DNA_ORIENTATION=-
MDQPTHELSNELVETILENLRNRNKIQSDPFTAIYQSNTKLWYECSRLQSLVKDVKHQVAVVQHETSELLSVPGTDYSISIVDSLKSKLSQIQFELREKANVDSNEHKSRVDLSKKVRDQGKLIADQHEELKVAKTELSLAHEKVALLTEEIRLESDSSKFVKDELTNVRKLLYKVEQENTHLIERILVEKTKTAEAMDRMMEEGDKGS